MRGMGFRECVNSITIRFNEYRLQPIWSCFSLSLIKSDRLKPVLPSKLPHYREISGEARSPKGTFEGLGHTIVGWVKILAAFLVSSRILRRDVTHNTSNCDVRHCGFLLL
jgi:hypothetical protein